MRKLEAVDVRVDKRYPESPELAETWKRFQPHSIFQDLALLNKWLNLILTTLAECTFVTPATSVLVYLDLGLDLGDLVK